MNKNKIASLLIVGLTILVSFQNCSPVSYQESPVDMKLSDNSDSGQHYDGKIYVLLGALCSDQSEVHSKIVLKSATSAELVRRDCQNLNPSITLNENDFQLSSTNTEQLTFQNNTFTALTSATLGISNFVVSSNGTSLSFSYSYSGTPSWLQVFIDVDNNPATGFSFGSLGADYMIENDNLWKYSAPAGSPSDTFAWTVATTANKVNVAPNISWRIPLSSLGNPTSFQALGHTTLGYSTPIKTVTP